MPQTSSHLSEFEVVDMGKTIPVIFEHRVPVGKCSCWNDIYETNDPQCKRCMGTGNATVKERSHLSKAVMKSSGGIVDDDEPIAHAFTFDDDIHLGDVIVCKGQKYKVIEIDKTNTLGKQEVIVCGLDYERNYNHNKADLERYK